LAQRAGTPSAASVGNAGGAKSKESFSSAAKKKGAWEEQGITFERSGGREFPRRVVFGMAKATPSQQKEGEKRSKKMAVPPTGSMRIIKKRPLIFHFFGRVGRTRSIAKSPRGKGGILDKGGVKVEVFQAMNLARATTLNGTKARGPAARQLARKKG